MPYVGGPNRLKPGIPIFPFVDAPRGRSGWAISAAGLAIMVLPLVVWSLLLPWYVVSSPESPNRPGSLSIFYIDGWEESSLRNGTTSSHYRFGYDVPEAAHLREVFTGLIAASAFFVFAAGLLIWETVRRGQGFVARVALLLAPAAGWAVVVYFAIAFTAAMQGAQEDWPGFFASVDVAWAGVVLTFGPGIGWFVSVAGASLATMASLMARRALAHIDGPPHERGG